MTEPTHVDGNAAAGAFADVLGFDVTTATLTCARMWSRRGLRRDSRLSPRPGHRGALPGLRPRPGPASANPDRRVAGPARRPVLAYPCPGPLMESLDALASRVRTADVVDAMGRLHQHRCHLLDLVSPTPGRRLFGPAVTISYFPACGAALPPERYNFKRLFYQAIEGGADGHVLVLASNGYTDASLGGGTKLSRVQNHRLAGILADGRLRDFAELEHYDLAIYCRGETTRWGGDTVTPYEANRPVVIGGVAVCPGDYVFADASGAAVIPAGDVRAVLHTANQVVAADAASIVTIRGESPNTLGDSEN